MFFSNFRSDHFGRSKVARRSERGGGKKPQVQEKVPCRAIFCLSLSESFFLVLEGLLMTEVGYVC